MRIINTQGREVDAAGIVTDQTGRMLVPASGNYASQVTPVGLGAVTPVAYFAYLGRTTLSILPKYVEFWVNGGAVLGNGAQVAEVGIFSTPSIPAKSGQTLTKLAAAQLQSANGAYETLTSSGQKRNNANPFTYNVAAGTYLWAGIRVNMTGTTGASQPLLAGLGYDFAEGLILSVASANALTNGAQSTWAGALITPGTYYTTAVCPDLRVTLD